ncbi:MAG: hypothetical protein HC799_17730 [Limnothrix sp. RL_2_0]|nr:hypothetical protein [Limnothrix sp. RL_2_0]
MNTSILHTSLQKLKSPTVVLFLFTLLGGMALSQHAFWRDEVNPWLIARDSNTWEELWKNVRYEGHPILWYLCLVVLNHVTHSIISMQVFHLFLGVGVIFLFWFYSPFNPLEKLLFTFGYFPFYEYFIISRNYVFGLLGSFLFCSILPSRKNTYIPISLVLGLTANSHAYALFIALYLGFVLFLEFIFDSQHRQQYFQASRRFDLILSVIIFLGLTYLATYMILPPNDSLLHGGESFFLDFDMHRVLWSIGRISGAYLLLIPKASSWFDLILVDSLILGIVLLVTISLLKKPYVLCFYLLATISITFIFFYGKYLGGFRHFGSLYVVLIVSLWMSIHFQENDILFKYFNPSLVAFSTKLFHWIFLAILTIHLLTGIALNIRDLFVPWSASRATANYMIQEGLEKEFIVASMDSHMAPLSGYLDRKLYYPEIESMGSFTLFLRTRQTADPAMVLSQTSEILSGDRPSTNPIPSRVLLLLNTKLDLEPIIDLAPNLKITPIAQFEKSYIHDEKYFLYWVELR